jgi:transposase InsO family protein
MKGETLLETLYRLGIAPSYSRPRTSHDNPYSEALFRTCKYCPAYPAHGFAGPEVAKGDAARTWMQQFVHGYNHEHRHSGLRFVTPHASLPQQRHQGQAPTILAQRQAVYEQARACHPERWSGATRNWEPIAEVWLNPSAEVIDGPASKSQAK